MNAHGAWRAVLVLAALVAAPLLAAERPGREIEEIVITAEKREATVSDTSISISAFDESFIETLGMQGPDALVKYIPATTSDLFDVRIRGVGRNFRWLGGDPGVATYYNGVYSEDFFVAASENALYDVERIEVLRGPQGTLYGRNAIGGAINYITNPPTFDWTGEARTQFGNLGAQEYYGIVSGPLIADRLAIRLMGLSIQRDGSQRGFGGSEDANTLDDNNIAIALLFEPTDALTMNLRWNERRSDRVFIVEPLINEGPMGSRGVRDTVHYAYGLRLVPAGTPGALPFTHPLTGATLYGAYVRPGVDASVWPYQPNPGYLSPVARLNSGGGQRHDLDHETLMNDGTYETFDQTALATDLSWTTSLGTFKYIFGWSDFEYRFDRDYDFSNESFSQGRAKALEDVYTHSHELQYLWQVGDALTGTSGLYKFYSRRRQDFGVLNATAQGRYTNPMDYGALGALPLEFGPIIPAFYGPHRTIGSAGPRQQLLGVWGGDPEGYVYRHQNELLDTSYAAYTQVKYAFNADWALTLGIRWAKDDKEADEQRAGYFEDPFSFTGYLVGLMPFFGGSAANTPLANANILWGAATLNTDLDVQIDPTCGLKDPCVTPLRLGGIPFSFATHTGDDHSWSHVTWRINLDWTPNEGTLVYVSATTGYRSGGYSLGPTDARDYVRNPDGTVVSVSLLGAPFIYDEETLISYEIGYKGTLIDDTVQLFASMYVYGYDDYQDLVTVYDPLREGGVEIVTTTDAENFGFEAELTWLATDALTLNANYSYTHAEYTADHWLTDFENPARPPSIFGAIAVPANRDLYVVNVNGNDLKRIPRHKSTVWGSYRWVTEIGDISANATIAYVGDYFSSALNTPYDETPSYSQVDMSVIWSSLSEKVRVRAFVDNVFDDGNVRNVDNAGERDNWRQWGENLYARFYGVDIRWAFGGA